MLLRCPLRRPPVVKCPTDAHLFPAFACLFPRVYYGSEWLFAGGNDPNCREPLWSSGVSYDAAAAPLGTFLAAINAYRKKNALWKSPQVRLEGAGLHDCLHP